MSTHQQVGLSRARTYAPRPNFSKSHFDCDCDLCEGIVKGCVRTRNKGVCVSICLRLSAFAHICLLLLAFLPLRLLAFVNVCLHLFTFARVCLRPPLPHPPPPSACLWLWLRSSQITRDSRLCGRPEKSLMLGLHT